MLVERIERERTEVAVVVDAPGAEIDKHAGDGKRVVLASLVQTPASGRVAEVISRLVLRPIARRPKEDELPEGWLIHGMPIGLVGDVEQHPKCCPARRRGLGWLGEEEVAQHRPIGCVGGSQLAQAGGPRVLADALDRHGGLIQIEVLAVIRGVFDLLPESGSELLTLFTGDVDRIRQSDGPRDTRAPGRREPSGSRGRIPREAP